MEKKKKNLEVDLGGGCMSTWMYLMPLNCMLKNSNFYFMYICYCSVTQLCPTLCDPMDCSTPDFPVPHHLPEFAQVHFHWIGVFYHNKKNCNFLSRNLYTSVTNNLWGWNYVKILPFSLFRFSPIITIRKNKVSSSI